MRCDGRQKGWRSIAVSLLFAMAAVMACGGKARSGQPTVGPFAGAGMQSQSGAGQRQTECDRMVEKAFSQPAPGERLAALVRVAESLPGCARVHREIGQLTMELKDSASADWPEEALERFQTAAGLDPTDAESHWSAGSLLEYLGRYREAVLEYRWLTDRVGDPGVTTERCAEAKIHMLTCRFLAEAAEKGGSGEMASTPAEHSTSPDAGGGSAPSPGQIGVPTLVADDRPEWGYLEHLVAAVAIAGGMHLAGSDNSDIQSALNYLYSWRRAPVSGAVDLRNRMVAGLVSWLVSEISGKQLRSGVESAMQEAGYQAPVALPEPGYAGDFERDYMASQPPSEQVFDIGDRLRIVQKSGLSCLEGTWVSECVEHHESLVVDGRPFSSNDCSDNVAHVAFRISGHVWSLRAWVEVSGHRYETESSCCEEGECLRCTVVGSSGYGSGFSMQGTSKWTILDRSTNQVRVRADYEQRSTSHSASGYVVYILKKAG